MTPSEQKRKEIEYLMKLPYVLQLQQIPLKSALPYEINQEESKD